MAKYRVTLRVSRTETVEADNPYQAAVISSARHDGNAEVVEVHRAAGRPAAKKRAKKVGKRRRQLSPEARAKLAQNLVKARAPPAGKRKAAAKKYPAKKKTTKKARKAAKKATKKTVKKG